MVQLSITRPLKDRTVTVVHHCQDGLSLSFTIVKTDCRCCSPSQDGLSLLFTIVKTDCRCCSQLSRRTVAVVHDCQDGLQLLFTIARRTVAVVHTCQDGLSLLFNIVKTDCRCCSRLSRRTVAGVHNRKADCTQSHRTST